MLAHKKNYIHKSAPCLFAEKTDAYLAKHMFCLLSTLTLRLSDLSPTFFSEAGFLRSLFHIILPLDVYLSLFTLGYLGIALPFLYLYTQGIGIYRYLFTYNASSFPMCLYQLSCIIHPLLRSLSILRLGFASSHIPL